jgi:hypothetical protein
MTWIEACDYATPHPNPAGLYAAGIRVVLRYAGSEAWKCITAPERDRIFAANLRIRAMYEDGAQTALKGFAEGVKDAKAARAAWTALGYPADYPIAFAVDFDATPDQLAGPVSEYVTGINSVEGSRDEEYGGIRTIDFLTAHRLSNGGFQTYAWSAGQWSAHAEIEQYHNGVTIAGGDVDRCRISSDALTWGPDMALEDTDVTKIWTADVVDNWRPDAKTNPEIQTGHALGYIGADVAALITTVAAQGKTIIAMSNTLTTIAAKGTSVDTATVLAAIQQVGNGESDAVKALQAQVAALQARLAAAGGALAAE